MRKLMTKHRASQNHRELAHLLDVVSSVSPLVIVEIGIHMGYSLEIWRTIWPEAVVIGIDPDISQLDQQAVAGCNIVEADSHSAGCLESLKDLLAGRSIDFLFIDGDHSYAGVKQDFNTYSPLVRQGGIIALHDAYLFENDTTAVRLFWDEIRNKYSSELVVANVACEDGKLTAGTGTGIVFM